MTADLFDNNVDPINVWEFFKYLKDLKEVKKSKQLSEQLELKNT